MFFRSCLLCALMSAPVLSAWAAPDKTLFDRLGGMEQIADIVGKTIDRTASDPRTSRSFEGASLAPVKASVVQHLCELTGGPCRYEGAPIAKAHTGLAITATEFDIMDGYLADELAAHGVAAADRAELQKLLGPMKPDVVGK